MSLEPTTSLPAADNKPVTPDQIPASTPPPSSTPPADNTPPADPYSDVDKPFLDAIEKVDGKPEPKPADKPAAGAGAQLDKPPGDKPAAGAAPAKGVPQQLRQQYDQVKTELEQTRARIPDLEKKIQEWEAKGKDTEVLRTRLEQLEKQNNELSGEVRMFKQEASPEFKAKYDQPFNDQAEYAKSIIEQMEIVEGDGMRPAKFEDFAAIYQMPVGAALKEIKSRFPDTSEAVIQHYFDLHRLDTVREKALREERANWQVRAKEEEGKTAQRKEQERLLRHKVQTDLVNSIEHYRDDAADKEATELRTKAMAKYDEEPQTARDRIIKEAHTRQRVAGYSVLLLKLARAEAKLRQLQGQADPNAMPNTRRTGAGGEPANGDEPWEDAARKELNEV